MFLSPRFNHFFIAKEGFSGLLCFVALGIIFSILELNFLSCLFFVLLIGWGFLFRNPERLTPIESNYVVAPCDGRVLSIKNQGDFIVLEIDIFFLNVGFIRSPISADIKKSFIRHGLLSSIPFTSRDLFRTIVYWEGLNFKMSLYPCIFRFSGYKKSKFQVGERMGFCKNGLLVLSLHQDYFKVNLNAGDQIRAGETLIGAVK